MKRSALLAVIVCLLLGQLVEAQRPAGMVLYFRSGGQVYLLLADHANGSTRG